MAALVTTAPSPRDSSPVSYGATLIFEELTAGPAPLRVRREEETLLRVIAGLVRLTLDDGERMLYAGEEAIVPAGTTHRLTSAYGEARIVTGFRRPRR
jgi:mannose-6-phosphate isomerase-like protein (cupin superfamily)